MVRRSRVRFPMFTIGVILSIIAIFTILYVVVNNIWEKYPTNIRSNDITPPQTQQPSVVIVKEGNSNQNQGDNPFVYENERNLQHPPAKPFYYPTRGVPQSYQQYGVLIGEERRHRGEQTILPLIGRQTYPGSSRYHYYTSTNGYHPMKLPVVHKKRTCNDSTGCEEIFSGNLVSVNGYDYDFKADIYPSPDLQYIL